MKWIKPLCNIVIPAVLFYLVYNIVGIISAVIISLVYSTISVIYSKVKYNTVKNSQIIGIIGLVGSATAVIFTGDEKLYYLPSILENMIFLGFMIVLSLKRKSVLHYLAKDFNIESLKQVPEASMFSINIIWIIYFILKIISKIVGILYLDFRKLYWIVFLLGDPMTILVIILSIILIRKKCSKRNKNY